MTGAHNVILWGGTGHARVLAEALSSDYLIDAIFDRRKIESPIEGVEIFHAWEGFSRWRQQNPEPGWLFAIAIGGDAGADRLEVDGRLSAAGILPLTIRHPASYAARDAILGAGAQLLAGSVLGANVIIGRQTIVNTRASVDHDCVVGDGVHIAPGATICGEVKVGDRVFIGAGAVILPKISIGPAARIGAGAVVTRDVLPDTTVLGVPAYPKRV